MLTILNFDENHPRLTVQEALAALDRRKLKMASRGRIDVSPYRQPSGEVLWCAAVIVDIQTADTVSVPLLTARRCTALFEGGRVSLGVEELHGATVDKDGILTLEDGRTVSGVTLEPNHRKTPFTELEEKILHCVIKLCKAEKACLFDPYLGLVRGFPLQIKRVALSELTLRIPLKVLLWEFEKLYPEQQLPSMQTVSALLLQCGIKLRKADRKAKPTLSN